MQVLSRPCRVYSIQGGEQVDKTFQEAPVIILERDFLRNQWNLFGNHVRSASEEFARTQSLEYTEDKLFHGRVLPHCIVPSAMMER